MVKVYAVVLTFGVVALIGWIFTRSLATGIERSGFDPEQRFGLTGRRIVAGMVGFGMAGMSAEFSPRGLHWSLALVLAVAGGAAAAWYAGRIGAEPGGTGD